jgi:Glycine zipper
MQAHFVKPVAIALAASLLAAQLSGCAHMPGQPSEPSGGVSQAGKGAALGAVLGAVLGSAASSRGDRTQGAIIGALAGQAIGGVIGDYRDKQTATGAQAAQRYGPGTSRLEVEGASVTPKAVRAGAVVESSVQYTTLAPAAGSQVNVRETRRLVASDNSAVPLGDRQVARVQGSHNSSIQFTMPGGVPPGNYRLVTTISDGQQSKTVERPLQVV